MSITDIPLVGAYDGALNAALQQVRPAKASEEPDSRIDIFKKVRDEYASNDEAPAHDLAVENVIRHKFVGLVSSLDIHQPEYNQVWDLIDLANALSDAELSEPSLGFYMIEELLDSQTIDGCRMVFDYLESRREGMVRKNFKTKSLVILRCCNELLRRLSRAEETVFCGRVFIYLFQTFPLGDRSSVNLRGVFHTENVTTFNETTTKSEDAIQPMDIDTEVVAQATSGTATPVASTQEQDAKTARSTPSVKSAKPEPKTEPPPDLDMLYPTFWSLQALFSDPSRLFQSESMRQFKDGVASTLSCFRYVTKHSAPATESLDLRRGLKRKRDEFGPNQESSLASKYNPKYLTSRDLFDLEIHDMAFRRHFLVQALIMLDFLLSLSPAAKAKTVGLTNRSVLYAYTLSDEDTKWAQNTRQSIATYLQQSGIGTEGSLYYRMVDTVLSRDKNWARWKAENCPPISRPPISPETYLVAQASLKELSKITPMVNPPGSNDFNFLSRIEPLESLKHPSQKHHAPTLQEYYKAIQGDELDLEMAMDDKEKQEIEEKKAGKLWRALRSATGKRFVLCEQIKNGDNLAALIETADEKIEGEDDNDAKIDETDRDVHDDKATPEPTEEATADEYVDDATSSHFKEEDEKDQNEVELAIDDEQAEQDTAATVDDVDTNGTVKVDVSETNVVMPDAPPADKTLPDEAVSEAHVQ